MNKFARAFQDREFARKSNNGKIAKAISGIPTKTSALKFNMDDTGHLTSDRRAHVKAMELVSDLLAKFDLGIRSNLEYHGVIKQATDKHGIIESGIIKIGAVLRTALGHKVKIDIPVIVRNKSLLEPALFFYDSAPYVMCAPALEQLVRRGSMEKNLQPRTMYSPPLPALIPMSEGTPVPVVSREHMYSPGIRHPYNLVRVMGQREQFDSINIVRVDGKKTRELDNDFVIAGHHYRYAFIPEDEIWIENTISNKIDLIANLIHEFGERMLMKHMDWDYEKAHDTISQPEDLFRQENRGVQGSKKSADVNMLDPAERDRDELCPIGAEVSALSDVMVRERGGGSLTIPKGESGKVICDVAGDGQILYVHFDDVNVLAVVPHSLLKYSSVNINQVKSEVRQMLREGYQKVDIIDAVQRLYPQCAQEVLSLLS